MKREINHLTEKEKKKHIHRNLYNMRSVDMCFGENTLSTSAQTCLLSLKKVAKPLLENMFVIRCS